MRVKNHALRDITNENQCLKEKNDLSKNKLARLKEVNEQLKIECIQLEADNLDLQSEEESCSSDSNTDISQPASPDVEATFQKIIGSHKYTPEVRKLYYSLIADQVPASKILDIIRSVLKCFNPSMDVDKLKLPKKTCASDMRKAELHIINNAHKAHVICKEGDGIHLNTDGTTKHQRKLGGVIGNDVVVCINELPDGKAMSIIEDISREFEKIRRMAAMLNLPIANSINWTMVKSATSDSASTQKCFNKLIEEKRRSDKEKFGPATCTVEALDLVETFCSMHLGVNLRKAFLSGILGSGQNDRYPKVIHLYMNFVNCSQKLECQSMSAVLLLCLTFCSYKEPPLKIKNCNPIIKLAKMLLYIGKLAAGILYLLLMLLKYSS